MKSLLSVAIAFFFLAAAFSTAWAGTAMETSMKQMADAGKQLGADLKQPDDTKHAKDLDLKSVATIKAEGVKAHGLTPKKEQNLPPDQQQTMTADFQKDMDAFGRDVDTLSQDIQNEKWNAARTDFQKLMDDEHAGHKLYRVKK